MIIFRIFTFGVLMCVVSVAGAARPDEIDIYATHSCDQPYMLGFVVRNAGARPIDFPVANLPWLSLSGSLSVEAYIETDERYVAIPVTQLATSYAGKFRTIEPGGTLAGAVDVRYWYPAEGHLFGGRNDVIFLYSFVESYPTPDGDVKVSAKGGAVFFPGSRWYEPSKCPIVVSMAFDDKR